MGDENLKWLPEGWKVDVKVRSYGRKDKYYIHPSNGLKFNSKAEVLRYLKSSGEVSKPKKQKKIDIKRIAAENLPPGWVEEIKTTKKGRKIRKDSYYIDPVSGRRFSSRQAVLRFLQNKDSGKAESKPDDRDHLKDDLKDQSQSSSAETKRVGRLAHAMRKCKKVTENNIHESVGGDRRLRSGSKFVESKEVDMPEEKIMAQRVGEDDSMALDVPNRLRNGKERRKSGLSQKKRMADRKQETDAAGEHSLPSGTGGVTVEKNNVPDTNASQQGREEDSSVTGQQQEDTSHMNKRRKLNSKRTSGLPRRTSKRLAHIEAGPSLEGKTRNKTKATATVSNREEVASNKAKAPEALSNGEEVASNKAKAPEALSNREEVASSKNGVLGTLTGEPEIHTAAENYGNSNESDVQSTKCKTQNPISNERKESDVISLGDLSCIEERNGVCIDPKNDDKDQFQLPSSLKEIFKDPCYEFAFKTLTDQIPIEEVHKVAADLTSSSASINQTSVSSSSLLPPAVKTFTGEIPVEEVHRVAADLPSSSASTNQASVSSSSSRLPPATILSDPAYEFAFKTLMSDIPVVDCSLFQNSFQQPLGFSRCNGSALLQPSQPMNHSFNQLESQQMPNVSRQGPKDPPPHAINNSSSNRRSQPSAAALQGGQTSVRKF